VTLEAEWAAFGSAHPFATATLAGNPWRWVVAGQANDPPLLLLGGALGRAEFAFQQIELLARHCRVIAPDYPAVTTLAELTAGLTALLDREGVARAHVAGGSFGGFMAQALLAHAPERVASLVLSHTGAPDGRRRRAGWLRMIPGPVLRWLLRMRLGRTLGATHPFWRVHFARVVSSLSGADIASRAALQAEFGELPLPPRAWAGPVLLLAAADDPLLGPAAQAGLMARFPKAERFAFEGTGHAAALLEPEAYAAQITAFVRRHAATS
jgi:pimeloyl-ACP methyl ester carboxylesterase